MITILGITLTYETLAFLLLFIASEVIGNNPKLKEGGVRQARNPCALSRLLAPP